MCADARRLCLTVAAVGVFAIMFPRASEAGTISIDTQFQGSAVGYHLDGEIHAFASDGLGSVTMSNAAGVDGIGFATAFEAYCVDIFGPIFEPGDPTGSVPPSVTVTAFGAPMTTWSDPDGLPSPAGAGAAAASLYNQFNPLIEGLASAAAFTFGAVNTTADVARTALAMSIWNTLYDGDDNVLFGVGNFYVWCDPTSAGYSPITGCNATTQAGSIVLLANAFMGAPVTGSTDATWLQLTNLNGTEVQDFVGPSRGGSTTPVPEPSSLALLGVGLAATAFAKRRGRRSAA